MTLRVANWLPILLEEFFFLGGPLMAIKFITISHGRLK
jgi:hypothetical protein